MTLFYSANKVINTLIFSSFEKVVVLALILQFSLGDC